MHNHAEKDLPLESAPALYLIYHGHTIKAKVDAAETTQMLLMRSIVHARQDNADWTLFCPNEAFDVETGKGLMDASQLMSVAQDRQTRLKSFMAVRSVACGFTLSFQASGEIDGCCVLLLQIDVLPFQGKQ